MFKAFSNFFAMFATIFEAGNRVANTINATAMYGEIKTQQLLAEELDKVDLTNLNADLIRLGLKEKPEEA